MWRTFEPQAINKQQADAVLQADVLVIGGSIAGCWAALVAKQNGAERVVVCEKGWVGQAGVVAQASGSAAYLIPGADAYNDKLLHSRHTAAEGMDDLDFVRYVFGESYQIALQLQALGFQPKVDLPEINGVRSNLLAFDGENALGFFRQLLLSSGVTVLDYSPALELLQNEHGDIVGANGINTHLQHAWTVLAGATIMATGGNAFRSGAMGTHGTTGDGHLLAAEAGASFSGMEFSGHYGISPQGSHTTKGFWLSSASFYDGNGQEIPSNGWESVHLVGKAILETGGAYASMNRGNANLKVFAKGVPSIYEHFQKVGIDPYTEKFPIELRYEGLIRSVGGIVINEEGNTGVNGLFAVGDVTERSKMTGAAMSGAGPAIAWCLVSAKVAGKHAAAWAQERPVNPQQAIHGLGGIGLRPQKASKRFTGTSLLQTVQSHILPIEKTVFRSLKQVRQSVQELNGLWEQHREQLSPQSLQDAIVAREAAAMLLDARMMLTAASERLETRGLHRLQEYPQADAAQNHHLLLHGLQHLSVQKLQQRPSAKSLSAVH